MKYAVIISTLTALVAARDNIANGGSAMSGGGPANAQAANNPGASGSSAANLPTNLSANTKAVLQAASIQWSKDTSLVSCALNMGLAVATQQTTMTDADFMDLMDAAYDAEVDETIQKSAIDAVAGDMPLIQSASANLTNGTFISVVDGLRELRIRGQGNLTAVKNVVDLMNTNRCSPIMNAIDAYVQTANTIVGNNTFVSAVRPMTCMTQILAQSARPISQQVVNNCTQTPKANEISRDYGQSPTFQLSNAVALGNARSTSTQGALNDTFPNQSSNMSSALGSQPGLFPSGFNINGPVTNTIANPVNFDLGFASAANTSNAQALNGATGLPAGTTASTSTGTGSTNSTGTTSTGTGSTNSTGSTGTGNTGSSTGTGNTGSANAGNTGAQTGAGNGANAGNTGAQGAQGATGATGAGKPGAQGANGAGAQAGRPAGKKPFRA